VDRHRDRRLRRPRLARGEEFGFEEDAGRAPPHDDGLATRRPAVSDRAIFQVGEGDHLVGNPGADDRGLDQRNGRPVSIVPHRPVAMLVGPLRVASLTARLGSFIDEGAIIGGARGFVFGLTLGGHTGLLPLADLGTETSKSEVGVDLTVEGTGYLGTRSPFPRGSSW